MLNRVQNSFGVNSSTVWLCAVFATAASISGCGEAEVALAPVTGFVTEGGKPMSNAIVEFFPETGRTSVGQTSGEGEFTMRYGDEEGVIIGRCKVQITPGISVPDVEEGSDQVAPPMKGPPEVIMVSNSIVVKSDDTNVFSFDLDDVRKPKKKK
ncbi:MAG: hypothetical protein ABJZ55_19140 [Fuerstiella sp.]